MELCDFNLAPAAKAMGLEYVPYLYETSSYGLAAVGWSTKRIYVDWRTLSVEYHTKLDIMLDALSWDRHRPYTDLMKWVIAHEMGHLLQLQEFGEDFIRRSYEDSVLPLRMQFASFLSRHEQLELEREYRATPWEADADMTAWKYMDRIEILA